MPEFSAVYAQLYDVVYQGAIYAVRALLAFLRRESFLYWPFLISTVVIAMLAWRFGYASGGVGPVSWREFIRRFFGGALWWHPSAPLPRWGTRPAAQVFNREGTLIGGVGPMKPEQKGQIGRAHV